MDNQNTLPDWGFWSVILALVGLIYARSDNVFNKINYWQGQLHEDAELRRQVAAQLRGHSVGSAYKDALQRALAWLDRVFGVPGSVQALEVCILVALAYAYASFLLGWGLYGVGDIGGFQLMPKYSIPPLIRLTMSAVLFVLPLLCFYLAHWLARHIELGGKWFKEHFLHYWQLYGARRIFAWSYRLLSLLTVIGACILLSLKTNIPLVGLFLIYLVALFPMFGAIVGEYIADFVSPQKKGICAFIIGAIALALPLLLLFTFPTEKVFIVVAVLGILSAATVSVSTALHVSVYASFIAVFVFFAIVLLLTGIGKKEFISENSNLIVVLAFVPVILTATLGAFLGTNRPGSDKRSLVSGGLGGIVGFSMLIGFTADKHIGDQSVLFLLLFFFMLPLANGIFDWLSWWVTRTLGRRLLDSLSSHSGWRRGFAIAGHGLADIAIAVALLLSMAYSLAFGFEAYNEIAKVQHPVFELRTTIADAAAAPRESGFWLTAMLLTTLIPTFGHGLMLLGSPLGFAFLADHKRTAMADALDRFATAGNQQISICRNTAIWLVRGQIIRYVIALVLLLWLLARFAAFIWWFQDGGLATIVANAAYFGIDTAEWLGHWLLGNH